MAGKTVFLQSNPYLQKNSCDCCEVMRDCGSTSLYSFAGLNEFCSRLIRVFATSMIDMRSNKKDFASRLARSVTKGMSFVDVRRGAWAEKRLRARSDQVAMHDGKVVPSQVFDDSRDTHVRSASAFPSSRAQFVALCLVAWQYSCSEPTGILSLTGREICYPDMHLLFQGTAVPGSGPARKNATASQELLDPIPVKE